VAKFRSASPRTRRIASISVPLAALARIMIACVAATGDEKRVPAFALRGNRDLLSACSTATFAATERCRRTT
jgi:hypothetical protein